MSGIWDLKTEQEQREYLICRVPSYLEGGIYAQEAVEVRDLLVDWDDALVDGASADEIQLVEELRALLAARDPTYRERESQRSALRQKLLAAEDGGADLKEREAIYRDVQKLVKTTTEKEKDLIYSAINTLRRYEANDDFQPHDVLVSRWGPIE